MRNYVRYLRLEEIFWALLATAAGVLILYVGARLFPAPLPLFWGVETFNLFWAMNVFLIPFFAGIAVSVIYGLGGKIIAHLAPVPILIYDYVQIDKFMLPEGLVLLPFYFWILILILAVEFAGFGGFVGEVIIKRTYGRRPKHLIHKRYAKSLKDRLSKEDPESLA